jgi:hypothetical protein
MPFVALRFFILIESFPEDDDNAFARPVTPVEWVEAVPAE